MIVHNAKNKSYELLKTGMAGGPSIVFCQYHESGKSQIHSHQYTDANTSNSVIGFYANSLYLHCSGQEMPCSKEEYVEVDQPYDTKELCKQVINRELLRFLQVETPSGSHSG